MIHVGQQSAFPKLKFIANRTKLERLIQQGRRQYRTRGVREDDLVNVLSEDDLHGLLKRTKSDGPDQAVYPMSGSESSSSAGLSRPGSPITLPLGFTFTRKNNKGLAVLNTDAKQSTETPDSPSLSKRLSGWWTSRSPRSTQASTPRDPLRSRSPFFHDRPNSMFELRTPKDVKSLQAQSNERPQHRNSDFLEEIRRRSHVFVEGEDSDGDDGYDNHSRRAKQHEGGTFGGLDAGEEDAEDYGEAADFGDDECDGDEVQNVGVGLGLEGPAL
jgi:hypothetical protein